MYKIIRVSVNGYVQNNYSTAVNGYVQNNSVSAVNDYVQNNYSIC